MPPKVLALTHLMTGEKSEHGPKGQRPPDRDGKNVRPGIKLNAAQRKARNSLVQWRDRNEGV